MTARCGAERFTVEANEIGGCVRGEGHRGVHRDAEWNEWGEPETAPDREKVEQDG